MSLSKNIALMLAILLISNALTLNPAIATKGNEKGIEEEEPKWWEHFQGDKNNNKIDDQIEELSKEERIGIFIDYDRNPTEEDVKRLSKFELDVKYVYKYIDVICARNVAISDVRALSHLPNVVMVKLEPILYPLLDISARAIKARASEDYSPYTAEDIGPYTGKGISIAILDTGVDDGGYSPAQRHEGLDDLDDNPSTNDPKFIAGVDFTQEESFWAPRDGSYNPDDSDGHGTHCAGIAMGTGAGAGDGEYRGMAPMARLVDLKIGEVWGVSSGDAIEAIEWCIEHKVEYNIRVLSCSFGSRFGESDGSDEESQVVNKAVEAGLVVVAAIGNDGEKRVISPAAADGAIAVGSVNDMETIDRSDDTLSSFSNTGPRLDDGDDDGIDELKPDVVAYGDSISSTLFNTHSAYISQSGTSMSTPHVAGVVALMLEANPSLTPENVKMILRKSAEARGDPSFPDLDPKYNTRFGWGIVDAYKAVEMARGYVEVQINIDRPTQQENLKGTVEILGTASVDRGSIGLVEVSIDDPSFQSYTLKAEGTSEWSVSWDTIGWNGQRTIYARAISGDYSDVASVDVIVNNPKISSGDEELNPEEGPPKINLPFGLGKVSLYAAAAFLVIVAGVIIAIVAGVLLRRKRKWMRMIAARRAEQGLR